PEDAQVRGEERRPNLVRVPDVLSVSPRLRCARRSRLRRVRFPRRFCHGTCEKRGRATLLAPKETAPTAWSEAVPIPTPATTQGAGEKKHHSVRLDQECRRASRVRG